MSKNFEDWAWKNVHYQEYANQPWSSLPALKPFFHRDVPAGGNGNTVNVAKYSFGQVAQNKRFKSTHSANYKHIVEYGSQSENDKATFSIEGGQNGNMLAGNYFDMNERHLAGEQYTMFHGKDVVEKQETQTLHLKQESSRPVV